MTTPIANAQVYGDFAGLESLKQAAHRDDPAAVREVARQFESLFARMLIKSMRDAIGPDPIFGSDQEQTYQDMFDDQLSLELTRGHGLGLADMLIRQLQRRGVAGAQGTGGSSGAGTAASSESVGPAQSAPSMPSGPSAPLMPATRSTPAMGGSGTRSTPAMGGSGTRTTPAMGGPATRAEQTRFIRDVWPHAQEAAEQLGVAPQSVVAQAALETDWGRRIPEDAAGRSSNNLFGIKTAAGWDGPSVAAGTSEFAAGAARATTAQFRAYETPQQSFADYVSLLKSDPRYASALDTGGDVQAFASALQRGGYATDPEYARKVSAVASDVASALAEPGLLAQLSGAGGERSSAASSANSLKLASAEPITGRADSLL